MELNGGGGLRSRKRVSRAAIQKGYEDDENVKWLVVMGWAFEVIYKNVRAHSLFF